MILIYNNKPALVLRELIEMGPENHYECLIDNRKTILAVQPSGRIVEFVRYFGNFQYYYPDNKFVGNVSIHRECGPAGGNYNIDYWTYFLDNVQFSKKCWEHALNDYSQ